MTGSFRRIQPPPFPDGTIPPLRMRRVPPLYPPPLWNVNEVTLKGESRTNNLCEAWNRSFASLVGHAHPTVWALIETLRKDFALVEAAMFLDQPGDHIP